MNKITYANKDKENWFLVSWALSNKCNYRCSYCPDFLHNGSSGQPDWNVVSNFIKNFKLNNKQICYRITGGEPTFWKRFIDMGKLIKELNEMNIKLNITAVYNASQTKKILKIINKKTRVIISIFGGRAADAGKDPIPEFSKSISYSKRFKNVQILWASVREPYNYLQAKQLGCHLITVPPPIIEKIEKFGKSYSQLTKETVNGFLVDSKKSKFKI